MEQHHTNTAPVHQLPSTSTSSDSNTTTIRSSSASIQSSLIQVDPTAGAPLQGTKRPNVHLGDQANRRKRLRQSPRMEDFKFDGSENPKSQSTTTPTSHEASTPTTVSPTVHEAPAPSFSSNAETPAPAGPKFRARSRSAPDQSTIVRDRPTEHSAIGRRSPSNACRKINIPHKSKKGLNEPPVNLATLRELDLKEILHNPRLRHDIYFDAALHFRPNLDGQRGQKKKIQADTYWENIVRECENVRRNQIGLQRGITTRSQPKRLMVLLDTMRDILLSLVPARDQKTVDQVFDQQLMMQQLEYGLLNFERLATWLASLLKAHCAPMRDAWVDDMVSKIKDGVNNESPRLLVEGLRSVFGILEAMKLDVANHQIRTLRPYLVSTAAEFEREHFDKRIEKGTLCVEETQEWYRELVAKRSSTEAPDYLGILTEGLLERLTPSNQNVKPPATFTFDLERLDTIRFDIREDVNMKTCLLLFRSLVNGLNKGLEVDKSAYMELTRAIQAINGDEEVSERWQRNSSALALQIAQSATAYASGKPIAKSFPDAQKVTFTENWLAQHLQPQSTLYQMFEKKVIEAIGMRTQIILKAWSHHKTPDFDKIPNTIMGLPADFASIPQRLAKILNLHWRVFEKRYISAAHTSTLSNKGHIALSTYRSDNLSVENSDSMSLDKKDISHSLSNMTFQHLEGKD